MACPRGDPCVHILGCVCAIVCRGQLLVGTGAGRVSSVSCCAREWQGGRGRSSPALRAGSLPARTVRSSGVPRGSWDPSGLARASEAAPPESGPRGPRGSPLRSDRGRGYVGHRLTPSPAWGRRTEPCSRVRSPGIAVTRAATWARHATFLVCDLLPCQIGTIPPSGSVVTFKRRTH